MSAIDSSILLIDDDADFGRSISLLLRQAGYLCDHAPDAATAKALFRRKHYNVIVTDVNMPDADGIELVGSLVKERRVPVIVITGNPTVQSTLAAMQISVTAFLIKPFAAEALTAEVKRAMAVGHILSNVSLNIDRIETWRSELSAFESMLKGPAQPTETATALVALTARHLMEGLADLRLQIAAVAAARSDSSPEAVAALNATKPIAMMEAIHDTIAVLDRTKDAFRSRELGELRKRLEALLLVEKTVDSPKISPGAYR